MLAEYPDLLLQVLAELRGAAVDSFDNRSESISLLAAQISDPISVQSCYQEAVDADPKVKDAIETLLKEQGEMAEAQFSREFGGIRQMGPAKLDRETPWLYPESIAELLYYYGLIGRTFKGAGQRAHTVVYLPSDIAPWLPHPQNPALAEGLLVAPVAPPPAVRTTLADDSFLQDTGTLLGFLLSESMRLTPQGPHPEDIDRLVQRLQFPFDDSMPDLNVRLALLLHLANRLGWLRRNENGVVGLTGNRVRAFLEKTRSEQRTELWEAWCESPEWNDLCRTPGLECAETGAWQNDPKQTRASVLQMVGKLQPGLWYTISDVMAAVKNTEPDFQRPTGRYDTWYIRNSATQEFLKGFEKWDAVEGALLRFLVRGPLHWLGVIDLADPSAGDNFLVSLGRWGAFWLGHETPQPEEHLHRSLTVKDDFSLTLALDAPLADRFRVERFAQWQSSYPEYRYQINQRSLKRAAESGVTSQQIVEFLKSRCRTIPDKVMGALARYAAKEAVADGSIR
jgi:hypothetical protein